MMQQGSQKRERPSCAVKQAAVLLLCFILFFSFAGCSFGSAMDAIFSSLSSLAGLQQTLILPVPVAMPMLVVVEVPPVGYLELSEEPLSLLQRSLPELIEILGEPPEEGWRNRPIWTFAEHSFYMGFSHLDKNGKLQPHSRSNLLYVPTATLIKGMPEQLTMEEMSRSFSAMSVFFDAYEDSYFLKGRFGLYEFDFTCDASGTVFASGYVYILDVTEGTL